MDSYLPVQWVYREIIEEEIAKKSQGKIFYFNTEGEVAEASGEVIGLEDTSSGVFIQLSPSGTIRIDRIITLFGKPGAAYDEYDAYSNACLDCMGGYTKEDLDKL